MRRTTKKPELLSPAGSFDALVAAVDAGADAVYLGGKRFQARAFSQSFDEEEMKRALLYCRLRSVKAYVTVNTLLFDRELEEAVEWARFLYESGASALICADIGLISLLSRLYPEIPIHASTQAAAHSRAGVDFLANRGARRVVLARELPFSEIETITNESLVETEIFLHGALCVSQSGQCLFSSMVGGRSGNRGMCAQPCRLPYQNGFPLSLKDLSLSRHIPKLCESGVSSLKIEGRMKSPSYVWHTTRLYRTLIDECRCATEAEMEHLERVFCRGDGFTDGYFTDFRNGSMNGVRSDAQKRQTALTEGINAPIHLTEIHAKAVILPNTPSSLTICGGGKEITVYGETPKTAQNAPLKKEQIRSRLAKMGGTLLSLSPEHIELSYKDGLFLTAGQQNALRRDAIDAFYASFLPPKLEKQTFPAFPERITSGSSLENNIKKEEENKTKNQLKSKIWNGAESGEAQIAVFYDAPVFDRLTERQRDFFAHSFVLPEAFLKLRCPPDGVLLPPMIFDREKREIKKQLRLAKEKGAVYALLSGVGQLSLVREVGLIPFGGFRLNVTNRFSAQVWKNEDVQDLTLSPELTGPQLRDIGGRCIVYGRIPLMVLHRCVTKQSGGCSLCGHFSLTDRTGARFPLLRTFGCRSELFNSLPTSLSDRKEERQKNRLKAGAFLFTTETEKEIGQIISAFESGASLPFPVRRLPKEN